jgi:RHS repeat-associated protein
MDDKQRIALVRFGTAHPDDRGPAVQFHLGDHLGSSNVVVDSGGALVNREEFTPYGETSFGSFARKRYRFTGKERDEESGLNYHGARYYASWLAHWLSVDPYLVTPERIPLRQSSSSSAYTTKLIKEIQEGKSDMMSSTRINSYCYSLDNPINLLDPNGAEPVRERVGEFKNVLKHVQQLEKSYADNLKGMEFPSVFASILGVKREILIRTLINREILEEFTKYETFDKPGERYFYTKHGGWIDMGHFARAAGETGLRGDLPFVSWYVERSGWAVEIDQLLSSKTIAKNSAFSYEDLPSNRLGIEFARNIDFGRPLSTQLNQFFQNLQPTKPQNAPNWKAVPEKREFKGLREPPMNFSDQPVFTIPANGNQPVVPEDRRKVEESLRSILK